MSKHPTELASDISDVNPYEGHAQLSPLEADVLWEYAKLSQNIKQLVAKTRQLSEGPDKTLLSQLRVLERKMGLVLTLFKASAWAVISEQATMDTSLTLESAGETTAQQSQQP